MSLRAQPLQPAGDPFERASRDGTMFYNEWLVDRMFLTLPRRRSSLNS